MSALVPHVPADLVDRLAKVAGLLGSDHDGERSAAAFRATALIRDAGLTWAEVIRAAGSRSTERHGVEREVGVDWYSKLTACLHSPAALTSWERDFILSICAHGRKWRPSAKQVTVLDRIYAKVTAP